MNIGYLDYNRNTPIPSSLHLSSSKATALLPVLLVAFLIRRLLLLLRAARCATWRTARCSADEIVARIAVSHALLVV